MKQKMPVSLILREQIDHQMRNCRERMRIGRDGGRRLRVENGDELPRVKYNKIQTKVAGTCAAGAKEREHVHMNQNIIDKLGLNEN